ncbi:unnamed protein product [Agarophyton chilense]
MVIIPLKSQHVSLVATFMSVTSETALLFAALRWNCLFENKTLQRRRTINVRNHRTRTKLLAAAATVIFVIIELFNSFYSDPTTVEISERRPCTFLASGGGQKGFTNTTSLSSIILLHCLDANRTTIRQSGGYLFQDGNDFVAQCLDPLYSFSTDNAPQESVPETDYFTGCVELPELAEPLPEDETTVCVFFYQNKARVTFTESVLGSDVPYVVNEKLLLHVWHTDVYFNITGMETEFARRAATMLLESSPPAITLRREVFTVDGVGMCDFKKQIEATTVSEGFIYALALASSLSFLVAVASLFFRSHMCFDMSNPLDWAQKTVISEHLLGAENPEVFCLDSEEKQFIVLSNLKKSCASRVRLDGGSPICFADVPQAQAEMQTQ